MAATPRIKRHFIIAPIIFIVAAVIISHGSAQFFSILQPVRSTPILQNASLTPGATLSVGVADVCTDGYTKAVRNVPVDVKRQVYAEYGITHHQPGEYEVDHLISLELGGSNSIKNLWPESYRTHPWNAHIKDQLENHLNDLVCSGQMGLPAAQHVIASNWIDAYKQYFHTSIALTDSQADLFGQGYTRHKSHYARKQAPTLAAAGESPQADGADGMVWVNSRSKKYFTPGSKYYGKTKQGEYMSESDAIAAGNVAAK